MISSQASLYQLGTAVAVRKTPPSKKKKQQWLKIDAYFSVLVWFLPEAESNTKIQARVTFKNLFILIGG